VRTKEENGAEKIKRGRCQAQRAGIMGEAVAMVMEGKAQREKAEEEKETEDQLFIHKPQCKRAQLGNFGLDCDCCQDFIFMMPPP
jgi:hypothetical protein